MTASQAQQHTEIGCIRYGFGQRIQSPAQWLQCDHIVDNLNCSTLQINGHMSGNHKRSLRSMFQH